MTRLRGLTLLTMPLVALALGLLGAGAAAKAPPAAATDRPGDVCAAPPTADTDKLATWLHAECYKQPALGYVRDKEEKRQTGPTPATAPHGRVTVYYSKEVYDWLKRGRSPAAPPDGAVMVKEMFNWKTGAFTGRAAMLKQKSGSFPGWFFYPGAWVAGGCIGCHASARSELTFADLEHIDGSARPARAAGQPSALALASHPATEPGAPTAPGAPMLESLEAQVPPPSAQGLHLRQNPDFARLFPRPGGDRPQSVLPLPPWQDALPFVAGPGGPVQFVPSTNCFGCHDAQVADKSAAMVAQAERRDLFLNLSPYGEWSASLMGLSGRDPVFHAQLASEKELRPALAGALDDNCYRCHGVAGQRQIHQDLHRPFTHELVYAGKDHPLGRYGALARDGVTCTVCHHIAAAGLGQEQTFTGQFQVGPPGEVFGPFADQIKPEPMKQALGITPVAGDHLRRAALCGSCHTVILPRVPAGYKGDPFADRALGREHEQTTYLEWRHSAYQDEAAPGPQARTCQGCHMPTQLNGPLGAAPLATKIANIEEYLPNVPSTLQAADITLAQRKPYARHTLVGINVFVMQMFTEFPGVLGIARRDPLSGGPSFLSSLKLAQREAQSLAQRETAKVELVAPPRATGAALTATVRVTNLAGHKLPSGVGFRRAFLEFQVLDAGGRPLWTSGGTSPLGVILGPDGAPLASEFTHDPAALQGHHGKITRADQVQIYEERSADDGGRLTTSFLGLFRRVKDNRLLPLGWSRDAPEFMQPVGPGGQRIYADSKSWDEVTYAVPLAGMAGAATVQATLYYQAIPPYYLADRFSQGAGPDTQRLYLLASGLDTSRGMQGWKLRIAGTGPVPIR